MAEVESDGTEGSYRMMQARNLCSEDEATGSSCSEGEDDDDDDGDLFLSDASSNASSDASSDSESEPLPVPTAAGYCFLDPNDLRTRFARVTKFRGQNSCRCYQHSNCSWLLPVGSRIPVQNQIRWAKAGLKPEVRTKDDHFALRGRYSDIPP